MDLSFALPQGPIILVLPVIILVLAFTFRKFEQIVSGSSYWKGRQSNYWLLLLAWALFYFFFAVDCNLKPLIDVQSCALLNQVLVFIFMPIALIAAVKWFLLSRKHLKETHDLKQKIENQ